MSSIAASLLGVLVIATLLASPAGARPPTLVRDEIAPEYTWDLSDIYASWEAWEADFERLETLMDDFAALKGTLAAGPDSLVRALELSDELGMLADKVYGYASLSYVTDLRDNDIAARQQQVSILFSRFGTATAWLNPELLSIPWKTMEAWLDATPALAPYRFGIEDLYRQQEHVLSEDKEELLSYFSRLRASPSEIFDQLSTADIEFPEITLASGDTLKVTPGTYYNILETHRNQADRARAFEAHYGVYNAKINTYAAIYNGVLQRNWAMAQARNYDSCVEAALDSDNIPVSVYGNLVDMVQQGAEPLHRYNTLRKQTLGLDEYHTYDGWIPLVEFDKTYDYDEVQTWIVESLAPLGTAYQDLVRRALEGRWLDVYENEGKATGAFSAGVYGVHPYMLLNYSDTLSDVFTLTHELGHTVHTMLSHEHQPYATSEYTIFVAEVPSTLHEALFLDYMLDRSEDPAERVALLMHAINNIVGTFYAQAMFANYELQAHRLVEQGQPITADALKKIYTDLTTAQQGPAVTFDDYYGGTWARIDHFYSAPFYVYQYATCYASSSQLHEQLRQGDASERRATVDRYLELLESGGNDYPMEQLKKAGVDLTKSETFEAVIADLGKLVDRLEVELAKL